MADEPKLEAEDAGPPVSLAATPMIRRDFGKFLVAGATMAAVNPAALANAAAAGGTAVAAVEAATATESMSPMLKRVADFLLRFDEVKAPHGPEDEIRRILSPLHTIDRDYGWYDDDPEPTRLKFAPEIEAVIGNYNQHISDTVARLSALPRAQEMRDTFSSGVFEALWNEAPARDDRESRKLVVNGNKISLRRGYGGVSIEIIPPEKPDDEKVYIDMDGDWQVFLPKYEIEHDADGQKSNLKYGDASYDSYASDTIANALVTPNGRRALYRLAHSDQSLRGSLLELLSAPDNQPISKATRELLQPFVDTVGELRFIMRRSGGLPIRSYQHIVESRGFSFDTGKPTPPEEPEKKEEPAAEEQDAVLRRWKDATSLTWQAGADEKSGVYYEAVVENVPVKKYGAKVTMPAYRPEWLIEGWVNDMALSRGEPVESLARNHESPRADGRIDMHIRIPAAVFTAEYADHVAESSRELKQNSTVDEETGLPVWKTVQRPPIKDDEGEEKESSSKETPDPSCRNVIITPAIVAMDEWRDKYMQAACAKDHARREAEKNGNSAER